MIVIYLIVIGALAGWLATRMMDIRANPATTVGIGIVGALIGGILLKLVLFFLGIFAGLIGAVLGALLLIWAWQTWFGGKA